jgi:hypothetical protein
MTQPKKIGKYDATIKKRKKMTQNCKDRCIIVTSSMIYFLNERQFQQQCGLKKPNR